MENAKKVIKEVQEEFSRDVSGKKYGFIESIARMMLNI